MNFVCHDIVPHAPPCGGAVGDLDPPQRLDETWPIKHIDDLVCRYGGEERVVKAGLYQYIETSRAHDFDVNAGLDRIRRRQIGPLRRG